MSINKFYNLAKYQLYPICRSITGRGTRKTLSIIKSQFPSLKILKILSGKKVYDWTVPLEWRLKKAQVHDKFGKKIIDYKSNNLQVIGYSAPKKKIVSKKELLKNISTLSKQPNAIPYITSYYKKRWGFCLSQNKKNEINRKYDDQDKFKIVIDSKSRRRK